MKGLLTIVIVIALVVLIGTFPLSILSKIFEFFAMCCKWLAKTLNIFGWNGIL